MQDFNLGDYVRTVSYYEKYEDACLGRNFKVGYSYGKVVAIDKSPRHGTIYRVRFGAGKNDVLFLKGDEIGVTDVVVDLEQIENIDKNINGAIEITPAQLREAFAEALGVKDATGWRTGEAIIHKLWGGV